MKNLDHNKDPYQYHTNYPFNSIFEIAVTPKEYNLKGKKFGKTSLTHDIIKPSEEQKISNTITKPQYTITMTIYLVQQHL